MGVGDWRYLPQRTQRARRVVGSCDFARRLAEGVRIGEGNYLTRRCGEAESAEGIGEL